MIKCGHRSSVVLDSRMKHSPKLGWHKHRRRQCDDCGAKFSTKEVRSILYEQLKKNEEQSDDRNKINGQDHPHS